MIKIGIISISDRASENIYEDQGIPSVINFFNEYFSSDINKISIDKTILIPDDLDQIKEKTSSFINEPNLKTVFLKPKYGDASGVRGAAILSRQSSI